MKDDHVSSSESELTPININDGSFENFLCSERSDGIDSTHGGHQVPQKSNTTTFPSRSSEEMCSPSDVTIEKSGA